MELLPGFQQDEEDQGLENDPEPDPPFCAPPFGAGLRQGYASYLDFLA